MLRILYCKDAGFDCDGVIRADTEAEALRMADEHARQVYGSQEVSAEVVAKIKSAMREAPISKLQP